LNKVTTTKDDACAGGGGYFAYDPSNNDGWCGCCTNEDDAVTNVAIGLFG